MTIEITYCVQWNYLPQATSLAAELERRTGSRPRLVEGSRGIFDVRVDGKLVYSKYQTGRFPGIGDLEASLG